MSRIQKLSCTHDLPPTYTETMSDHGGDVKALTQPTTSNDSGCVGNCTSCISTIGSFLAAPFTYQLPPLPADAEDTQYHHAPDYQHFGRYQLVFGLSYWLPGILAAICLFLSDQVKCSHPRILPLVITTFTSYFMANLSVWIDRRYKRRWIGRRMEYYQNWVSLAALYAAIFIGTALSIGLGVNCDPYQEVGSDRAPSQDGRRCFRQQVSQDLRSVGEAAARARR